MGAAVALAPRPRGKSRPGLPVLGRKPWKGPFPPSPLEPAAGGFPGQGTRHARCTCHPWRRTPPLQRAQAVGPREWGDPPPPRPRGPVLQEGPRGLGAGGQAFHSPAGPFDSQNKQRCLGAGAHLHRRVKTSVNKRAARPAERGEPEPPRAGAVASGRPAAPSAPGRARSLRAAPSSGSRHRSGPGQLPPSGAPGDGRSLGQTRVRSSVRSCVWLTGTDRPSSGSHGPLGGFPGGEPGPHAGPQAPCSVQRGRPPRPPPWCAWGRPPRPRAEPLGGPSRAPWGWRPPGLVSLVGA